MAGSEGTHITDDEIAKSINRFNNSFGRIQEGEARILEAQNRILGKKNVRPTLDPKLINKKNIHRLTANYIEERQMGLSNDIVSIEF